MKKKLADSTSAMATLIDFEVKFRRKQERFRKKLKVSESYLERHLEKDAQNSITS